MRKRFLEFDDDDVHRLEGMYDLTLEHVDAVIEAFYEHVLSFPETAAFFRDPQLLEHVKGRQKEYFIRLTQGDYEAGVRRRSAPAREHPREDRAPGPLLPRDVRALLP